MEQLRPTYIEKNPPDEPAEDFDLLVEQGIKLLQKLTGTTWTDYNVHDPGVTILEQLCFAFTDLAYRTGFPVQDILTGENGEIVKANHCFFDKGKILTVNPVSINDFRKVILDEIEEIDNVQIEPLTSAYSSAYTKGLYKILVRVSDAVAERFLKEPGLEQEIIEKVRSAYLLRRNMGEDILREIVVLKPQVIHIRADILVKEFIQPEDILLDIYKKVHELLSPRVHFYAEQELLSKGLRPEEIYQGPLLKHGIIPDSELRPMVSEVDSFEIIKAVSSARGVLLVQKLFINEQAEEDAGKPFLLAADAFPLLDVSTFCDGIQLFTGEYRLNSAKKEFLDLLDKTNRLQQFERRTSLHAPETEVLKTGTFRDTGKYFSIQQMFPGIYGLGEEGVYSFEPDERKAQVKQLKAYLLFFEQILANYAAQLSSVNDLFSTEFKDSNERSYFYNTLYHVPHVREIFYPAVNDKASEYEKEYAWTKFKDSQFNPYIKSLKEDQESVSVYRLRKHLAYEHLYGRFNEKFSTYPVLTYIDLYGDLKNDKPGLLIRWKAEVLKNFPQTEYNRVKSFNYYADAPELSGFEKKILLLLHIPRTEKKRLSAVFESGKIAFVSEKHHHHLGKINEADIKTAEWSGEKIDLVSDVDDVIEPAQIGKLIAGGINQKYAYFFRKQGISVLKHGINEENYRIGPSVADEKDFIIVYKDPAKDKWRTISHHPSRESAHEALKRLIAYLRRISLESEGFHMVEHVLLRPTVFSSSFGYRFYRKKGELLFKNTKWLSFAGREQEIFNLIHKNSPGQTTGAAAHVFESVPEDFSHRNSQFYPRFEMMLRTSCGKELHEEFFNMRMSVVLPSWPARFQEPEFRSYVEDLIVNSAPAYLQINFMWLGVEQMRGFENLYFNWLASLKEKKEENTLSEKMAFFLGAEAFMNEKRKS